MTPFALKIVTPDGIKYDGYAEEIVVRTTTGDLGIRASHINCVAPLGMGEAMIIVEGERRFGACIGGMVSVINGEACVVATTFEWANEIDILRAERAESRARGALSDHTLDSADLKLAEARLKRALIRKGVATRR